MRHERGFSMVELIVAMTVTLIVSSAIYGLLAAGNSAFRKEPEVADRQQNIRAAMDIIVRDVFSAGANMPTYSQVFARNDPAGACGGSLNSCGQAGTLGATAAAARGDDEDSDVLQMVGTDEQCPMLAVCSTTGARVPGQAGLFVMQERRPAQCMPVPGLIAFISDNGFAIQAATAAPAGTACTTAPFDPAVNANLTMSAHLAPWLAAGFAATNPEPGAGNTVYAYRARVVRYRIAPNPDPLDTAPVLWRTESGLYRPDGTAAPEPGGPGFDPNATPWQIVARGVEDLQVEFLDGNGAWLNEPPVSAPNDWTTLVRQVRVTLSARVMASNLGGESAGGAGGPIAVRGSLSTAVTPRSAYNELKMGNQIQ